MEWNPSYRNAALVGYDLDDCPDSDNRRDHARQPSEKEDISQEGVSQSFAAEAADNPAVSGVPARPSDQLTSAEQPEVIQGILDWICGFIYLLFDWMRSFIHFFEKIEGILTLIVAGFALRYAWRAWISSEDANVIARDELAVNRQNAIYEMQPYLSVEFAKAYLSDGYTPAQRGTGKTSIGIQIILKNSGKTPAEFVRADADPSSVVIFTNGSAIARFTPTGPIRGVPVQYVPGETSITMHFGGEFESTDPAWIADKNAPSRTFGAMINDNWKLTNIIINGLSIRFKDLQCRSTDWHKVITGQVVVAFTPSGEETLSNTKVYSASDCDDAEREEYKDYKPQTLRQI